MNRSSIVVNRDANNEPASAADEAARAGHFDNLPLAGKPLNLGRQSDPDWWIKGLADREQIDLSELVPPTIRLRRESLAFADSVGAYRREDDLVEAAQALNTRILADRLRPAVTATPVVAPVVDVEAMVELWRARRRCPVESPLVETPLDDKPATSLKPWWKWW